MSLQDLSDDDIVTSLLVGEIRRLDQALRNETKAKFEVVARYEKATTDKRELETRVALLEADLARLKAAKPDVTRARQIGPVHIGSPVEPKSKLAELMEKSAPEINESLGFTGTDYFVGIP